MTVNAVAHHMKKRVLLVDFTSLQGKRQEGVDADADLSGLLREADMSNAVLFFDEFENIFRQRESGGDQLLDALLKEIERYEGIVFLATNRPFDLDEEMHRRITAVFEFKAPDHIQRRKIWDVLLLRRALQTDPDIDLNTIALNASPPAAYDFSFGGCGFLIPYYLGVAQGLQDAGFIQPSSKFAGASGGAIAALTLAANASISDIHAETKALAILCRNSGTIWKLEERLRAVFYVKFGNLSVETLANRLTIATEKMWPVRATVWTDYFHSTEDLCDALIASCYVPWYLARRGTCLFRGEYHVDGGLITLVPEVPGYVKVCAFHAHLLRRKDYDISPSIDPDFPFSVMQLARFALFPPEIAVLDQLFELGKRSARKWKEKVAPQADPRNVI
ncbi:hypothetical protein PsorP6_000015 [Peronosclerospora sorghi]|uniref:Uncharacterized protein n=1 Tax=Peronosclerospora sorghi TaxID=230839 RepID=A0ACC0WV65_9STRA|nr:hypothetical protein PsorP6_000015 [Peronosclerospora sorghi]